MKSGHRPTAAGASAQQKCDQESVLEVRFVGVGEGLPLRSLAEAPPKADRRGSLSAIGGPKANAGSVWFLRVADFADFIKRLNSAASLRRARLDRIDHPSTEISAATPVHEIASNSASLSTESCAPREIARGPWWLPGLRGQRKGTEQVATSLFPLIPPAGMIGVGQTSRCQSVRHNDSRALLLVKTVE
jgi:hypothetical protein